jgi:hypothetical protein
MNATNNYSILFKNKPLGVISRLSSYLGYDELSLQLIQQGQVQR